jgi:uncharacterized protein YndB with AHSA1/START domain
MNIDTWTAEREVVVNASPATIFGALTDPEQLVQWGRVE